MSCHNGTKILVWTDLELICYSYEYTVIEEEFINILLVLHHRETGPSVKLHTRTSTRHGDQQL